MSTRFMTDPHEMRSMAGRFDVHAQTVEDEAGKMWASSQNIAGLGWSGTAQATSYDTMGQMNTAFRNIVNMLHGVRDGGHAGVAQLPGYRSDPVASQGYPTRQRLNSFAPPSRLDAIRD